jgi:hypothetical protein
MASASDHNVAAAVQVTHADHSVAVSANLDGDDVDHALRELAPFVCIAVIAVIAAFVLPTFPTTPQEVVIVEQSD